MVFSPDAIMFPSDLNLWKRLERAFASPRSIAYERCETDELLMASDRLFESGDEPSSRIVRAVAEGHLPIESVRLEPICVALGPTWSDPSLRPFDRDWPLCWLRSDSTAVLRFLSENPGPFAIDHLPLCTTREFFEGRATSISHAQCKNKYAGFYVYRIYYVSLKISTLKNLEIGK